jgi:hypothetical protein
MAYGDFGGETPARLLSIASAVANPLGIRDHSAWSGGLGMFQREFVR